MQPVPTDQDLDAPATQACRICGVSHAHEPLFETIRNANFDLSDLVRALYEAARFIAPA